VSGNVAGSIERRGRRAIEVLVRLNWVRRRDVFGSRCFEETIVGGGHHCDAAGNGSREVDGVVPSQRSAFG
jgi:hypothetical protein